MKDRTRAPALLLALALILSLAFQPSVSRAAAPSSPGYRVTGTYDQADNALTVEITFSGVNGLGGRLALGFDPTKLALPEKAATWKQLMTAGEGVTLSGEGTSASKLCSQERGHLMFAWYSSSGPLDGLSAPRTLATVTFTLQEGVTVDDLDCRSLYLYCVADQYQGWDTAAWLRGQGLVDYMSCVAGVTDCPVVFDYPNREAPHAGSHTVYITAQDTAGSTLSGCRVQLEGAWVEASAGGRAMFTLPEGTYTCLVTAPGYEDRVAVVEVTGGTVYRQVPLRGLRQLVQDVAASLEIGFQGEDTADHVTRDMRFPSRGEQNTVITWTTSDPTLVSPYGNVFRGETERTVKVTATVSKDSWTATKDFTVTLTARTVEQTPVEEEPEPTDDPFGENWRPPEEHPFTDLTGYAWAQEAVEALHALGVIQGTGPDTFSPAAPLTRADFTVLLMRLLEPEGEPGPGFADVPEGAYYHDAVVLAQGLGIVSGVGNGRFEPKARLTRQDMATLIWRALGQGDEGLLPAASASELAKFTDGGQVSGYAQEAMCSVVAAGLLQGSSGALNPTHTTTRAQAAVFLYRLLQYAAG